MYYDILPEDKKYMLETPETGSPHNRGLSVDVTLYSLFTGQEASMPSSFDEPSPRAYGAFQGGGELERYRRDLLSLYMVSEGFTGAEHEWWHFSYKNFTGYQLLNSKFHELREEKSVTG
jgi:D-alanyl-D-alanine dipeptidase